MTCEGICKGSFPDLLGEHVSTGQSLYELAMIVEPLLKLMLAPMIKELRELQQLHKEHK
jgi:hypothetical protein